MFNDLKIEIFNNNICEWKVGFGSTCLSPGYLAFSSPLDSSSSTCCPGRPPPLPSKLTSPEKKQKKNNHSHKHKKSSDI